MYSTSSISKRLVLVSFLAVVVTQLLLMSNVSSLNITNAYLNYTCLTNEGKYKPGSEHEKNLNDIIHAFLHYSDYWKSGYDYVFKRTASVMFQCRGDSFGPKCLSCYANAQAELRKRCPRYKAGVIWYDQCLVEFSSKDLFRKINYDDSLGLCISSAKNSSNKLVPELLTLLDKLKNIVNANKTDEVYAAGEMMFQKKKMYVMVQCNELVTAKDCNTCLSYIIGHFKHCYENKQGARVFLGGSCNFRFELYPFYNPKTSLEYYKF